MLKLAPSLFDESEREPCGLVDRREWDSILIDGRDCFAKGKFRHNEDGTITCALCGWEGSHTAHSLRERVRRVTEASSRYLTRR